MGMSVKEQYFRHIEKTGDRGFDQKQKLAAALPLQHLVLFAPLKE